MRRTIPQPPHGSLQREGDVLTMASTDRYDRHWLLSTDEVVANLAASYTQVHADTGLAQRLATLVQRALRFGDVERLLASIG